MNAMPVTAAERTYEKRSLLTLTAIATFARLSYTAVIDNQDVGNAAWIQLIGGLILSLPALAGMYKALPAKNSTDAPASDIPVWFRYIALFALFLHFTVDASAWFYALTESAAYSTFPLAPLAYLYLPVLIGATLAATQGGNACGGLAKLMLFTLPVLVGISLLVVVRQARPVWITPLLGGGLPLLLRGSVVCAGAFITFPAGVWALLCAQGEPQEEKIRARVTRAILISFAAAMAFVVLFAMLAPNIPNAPRTREFALERLLSGGGSVTSVQFPLLICWYSLLFLCSIFDVYAAARCLKTAFEKLSLRLCAWISGVLGGLWTLLGFSFNAMALKVSVARFVVLSAVFLLLPVAALAKRRLRKNAQK